MAEIARALNLLGFARKAGKLCLGTRATLSAVQKGKVRLVIVASDVSENTESKVRQEALANKTPIICVSSKSELGRRLGREALGVLGVQDATFAKSIQKYLRDH
ncbi:MAG: L7Ae/L30e/S12e/Gadd45 family ribosomal protein [bacterium]